MIEASAPTERRITCEATGRKKLLVEVLPDGLTAWCRVCHRPEPVSRAQIERMWAELDAMPSAARNGSPAPTAAQSKTS